MGMVKSLGIWLGLFEDENDRRDDDVDDFAVPVRQRSTPRSARPIEREGYTRTERDRDARDREPRDRDVRDRDVRDRDVRDRDVRDRDVRDRDVRGRDLRLEAVDDFDTRVRDIHSARESRTDTRSHETRSHETRSHDTRSHETRVPDPRLRPRSEQTGEHPTVRTFPRSTAGSTALSVPAHENLTNAPEVNLRERVATPDDRLVRPFEITMLHPTNYGDARAIGEQFRDGHPVIMNLTEMAEADAKRLVDFAAGLAFAVRGSMERVTNRVFLITPPNVRVSDEEKRRIVETGRFERP